jgi:hypothetical protein
MISTALLKEYWVFQRDEIFYPFIKAGLPVSGVSEGILGLSKKFLCMKSFKYI